MQSPKALVSFDNGDEFEVQARSRDLVAAEADGVDFQAIPPIRGSYISALYALRRLVKTGTIEPAEPLPADVDALIEVADITIVEDAEGNASGQEATPG